MENRPGKIYRIGGDEFAALLHADDESLVLLQEKFRETVKGWSGKQIEHLYISCGCVAVRDAQDTPLHEISRMADQKMYAEKAAYYRETGTERRRRS